MKKFIVLLLVMIMAVFSSCSKIETEDVTDSYSATFSSESETSTDMSETVNTINEVSEISATSPYVTETLSATVSDKSATLYNDTTKASDKTTTEPVTVRTTSENISYDYSKLIGKDLESKSYETDSGVSCFYVKISEADKSKIVFDFSEEYMSKDENYVQHWSLLVNMCGIKATGTSGTSYSFSGTYNSGEEDDMYGRSYNRRVSGTVTLTENAICITFSEVTNVDYGNYNDTEIPIGEKITFSIK